jgi:hypothetical protein
MNFVNATLLKIDVRKRLNVIVFKNKFSFENILKYIFLDIFNISTSKSSKNIKKNINLIYFQEKNTFKKKKQLQIHSKHPK